MCLCVCGGGGGGVEGGITYWFCGCLGVIILWAVGCEMLECWWLHLQYLSFFSLPFFLWLSWWWCWCTAPRAHKPLRGIALYKSCYYNHYFLQSSGAVWKSRRPSWAPVPNKPTVSVDVKQHFIIFFLFSNGEISGRSVMESRIVHCCEEYSSEMNKNMQQMSGKALNLLNTTCHALK